jgi:high-affinity iron transporter
VLAAFVIFLREGVEAGIVIAAMLAYLSQTGQHHRRVYVFAGAGAALILACGAGVAAYVVMRRYDGTNTQLVIELVSFLTAAGVLTVMLFWMRLRGPASRRALLHSTEHALGRRGGVALGTVAFVSVGREGLEAAVFALAIVFAGGRGGQVAVGGHGGGWPGWRWRWR